MEKLPPQNMKSVMPVSPSLTFDELTIDPARLCLKSVRLEPVERRGVIKHNLAGSISCKKRSKSLVTPMGEDDLGSLREFHVILTAIAG
jgi:hypothetical protein